MATNDSLGNQLRSVFSYTGDLRSPYFIRYPSFEDNNIFSLFFRVNISEQEMDVPLFCRGELKKHYIVT